MRAIAARVLLAHKTVRNYVSSIFRKRGFDDRVEAVIGLARPAVAELRDVTVG